MKNKYLQLRFLETGHTIASLKRATGLGLATVSDTINNKLDAEKMAVKSYNLIAGELFTGYEKYLLETCDASGNADSDFPVEVYALFKDRVSGEVLHLLNNHPDDVVIEIKIGPNIPPRVEVTFYEPWGFERSFWLFDTDLLSLLSDKHVSEYQKLLKEFCYEDFKNKHS